MSKSNRKNLPYMELYIGDWERDCNVLSLSAEMAWMKINFKMHLGMQSSFKIHAKGLQILWKSTPEKVQEYIDELLFNDICEIREIKGGYEFLSRRRKKQNSVSKVRSEAAAARWEKEKTNANQMQTKCKNVQNAEYEYDNEVESENEKGGVGENNFAELGEDLSKIEIPLAQLEYELLIPTDWKQQVRMALDREGMYLSEDDFDAEVKRFFSLIKSDGEETKTLKEAKKHFNRWLRKELKSKNTKSEKELEPERRNYG